MLADPSKETPLIVLAFAKIVASAAKVAVAAFPVVDPDEPLVFPVTLPVKSPVTLPVKFPVIAPVAPIVPTDIFGVPVSPAAVVAAIPKLSTYVLVMCACTSDWLAPV